MRAQNGRIPDSQELIRAMGVHLVYEHYPGHDLPKMARDWHMKYVLRSDLGLRQSEGVILGKDRSNQMVKRLLTWLTNIIFDATFQNGSFIELP